ncbi:DNA-binding SARP family transcriptional activator [Kribbella orskensis]|uniref:DNA-binding SARP family transcriptional activator n=1 Tax=Kribbella orskensis TaxID=2512216 RepID=A0ABY2BJF2_9ACTN|nr:MULTISPECIES: BTAD domain-containing putative transcriptional regulator [Kribbella]TCN40107.1 DNA-binding SARP family transcriptional activator [Kribbella sp. VKM Ac-2500]TCO22727.1 DNA-binding SARP family transcriptional activator [Kribbella orskensis]
MGIDVLGPITIEGDQKALGRRDRVVVAALAVNPGEVVSAEQLADVLWGGERLPPSWQKVVQGCVVRLRKVLGAHAIETLPLGYRLVVPLDEIDAQRFDRAVVRARELLAAGEPERSAVVLADALTLWRGRPLTELEGWAPARIEASRLVELRHIADELYVESALRSGQHDKVLAKAQSLVMEAPLRERRWVLLATAQYQAGRQGEALRTIQRLRTVLNRDLGLDPNEDVDALEQAILRQDPSLVAESALPEPSPICPYPGLKPYDVDDAATFFGRDSDIAACLRKLTDASVLAVAGPSGCGKSSLVRAGVAAGLRRDGKQVVVMTPGPHPVAALAAAMSGTTAPVLLVDQFEEVFSLCRDTAERESFLAALHAHQAPLVMSIRADRLADVSAHPAFARTVERGLYLLSGMTRDDLRAAIEEPARLSSLVVEPGLVDLLVNEVADQPGALPLMSHALRETWQRREGRTLTVAGYNASGGIRSAVAQSAEEVHERISPEQRAVLHDLLLRLVAPGPEGEPIRSRLPRRLVVTRPEDNKMIDLLVASRLLTSDAGVVEIAHESLVRAWPRLRGWLEDDLEGQRILHHLAVAADSWNNLDRPDSELYRGVRLAKAFDWRERTTPTLTATEEDFLAASKRLSETELRAAETRERLQLRVNRRLRAALATAAILLVGALIAGLVAVRQADRAELAASRELARQVGARALVTEDISQSLLLAAQGVRLDDAPDTRANLVAAINKHPTLVRSIRAPLGRTENIDVSPDGTRIVSGDEKATFHLYDAQSGEVLKSYTFAPVAEDAVIFTRPRFSPDGRLIAAIASDNYGNPVDPAWPVRLLDAGTLQPVNPQPVVPPPDVPRLNSVVFSKDGRYLALGAQKEGVEAEIARAFALVWNLGALDQPPRRVDLGWAWQRAALSSDGRTVYRSWPLTAFDVATGRERWARPDLVGDDPVAPSIGLPIVEVSDSGDLLAFLHPGPVRNDRTMTTIVDARTGKTVRNLRSTADPPRAADFSADGKLLATAHYGGEVVIWELATGRALQRLRTVEVSWAVAFSPDQRTVYTAGDQGIVRAYDLGGQRRYLRWTQAAPPRRYLHVLASGNGQRTAYLWNEAGTSWLSIADAATGRMTPPTRLDLELRQQSHPPASWHPNGERLLINDQQVVVMVDARTGKILKEHRGGVGSALYFGDGNRIVGGSPQGSIFFDGDLTPTGGLNGFTADCCTASSPDGKTAVLFEEGISGATMSWRIVEVATGKVVHQGKLPTWVNAVAYSPDGRLIAVTGTEGVVTIDPRSGAVKPAPTIAQKAEGVTIRFSPDGTRLVSGAADGTVTIWDPHTLESQLTITTATEGNPIPVAPIFTQGSDVLTIPAYDGKTYRWNISTGHSLAWACTMAGRNLTPTEWTQSFPKLPYQRTCP